jgi:hypothetical protein
MAKAIDVTLYMADFPPVSAPWHEPMAVALTPLQIAKKRTCQPIVDVTSSKA